jgi:cytochrome P450
MKEVPEIDIPFLDYINWELKDPIGLRDHIYKTYGGIAKQVVDGFTNYFLMHPDHAQVVFEEKPDDFFYRHPALIAGFEPLIGRATLFTQNNPIEWQKLRNIALRSMDVAAFFERYVNKSYEAGKNRIDEWANKYANGDIINISDEMDCMVINFVNNSFYYYISDRPEDIRALLYYTNDTLTAQALNPNDWNTPEKKKIYDDAISNFADVYRGWVRDRINSGRNIDDFIGLMIHQLSTTFSGEDLVIQAANQAAMGSIASVFTTSPALRFLLIELAKNPDVAKKVREEIDRIVGDGVPTYEHFKKMDYCSAVIKESLRLNTTSFSILRQAAVDTSSQDYFIPKDSGIFVTSTVIHRRADFWKDPQKFIPERFLENPMGQDHLFAYIPFGLGKRACIARHFSPLEILVVLVLIARNYRFELLSDEPVKHTTLSFGALSKPSVDNLIIHKI